MDFKIQWFPGHMTKAKRMMESNLKLVDVVVEMLDARIPRSSSNPMLVSMLGAKPKVIALNKADMADPVQTKAWLEIFKHNSLRAMQVDCATGKGVKALFEAVRVEAQPITDKWLKRGVKNRPIRVMIVGVPNVGKSTLINRIIGKRKVAAQDRPGVTRGPQWITIAKGLELLDTPGVLWPKFDEPEIGFNLAVTGAIREEVFDKETAMKILIARLQEQYFGALAKQYNIELAQDEAVASIINKIAVARGCLRVGGIVDGDKVINMVLRDFKTGKLGTFTLETAAKV